MRRAPAFDDAIEAGDTDDDGLYPIDQPQDDGWRSKKQKIGPPNYQTASARVLDVGAKKCFRKQAVTIDVDAIVKTVMPPQAQAVKPATPPVASPPPHKIEEPQTKPTAKRKERWEGPGRFNDLRVIVAPYLANRDIGADEKLKAALFRQLTEQVLKWHDYCGIRDIFEDPELANKMRETLENVRCHMKEMGGNGLVQNHDYQMMLKLRLRTKDTTSDEYVWLTSQMAEKKIVGQERLQGDLDLLTLIQKTLPKKRDQKVVSDEARAAARKLKAELPGPSRDDFDLWFDG